MHPLEFLRYHAEALYLFLPESWVYYAPAYMRACLDDYDESDMISSIFATTLHQRSDELLCLMNATQRSAIREFLEWLLTTESDHPRRAHIEDVLREAYDGP